MSFLSSNNTIVNIHLTGMPFDPRNQRFTVPVGTDTIESSMKPNPKIKVIFGKGISTDDVIGIINDCFVI